MNNNNNPAKIFKIEHQQRPDMNFQGMNPITMQNAMGANPELLPPIEQTKTVLLPPAP